MPGVAPGAAIGTKLRCVGGFHLVRGRRQGFAFGQILSLSAHRAFRIVVHGRLPERSWRNGLGYLAADALLVVAMGCLKAGLRGRLSKFANSRNAPGTPSGNCRYSAKAT